MKNSAVRFVLALLTLVVCAAGEELLPKPLGVGFPLLLAASVFFATRSSDVLPVLFALSAGAVEDSLSGLPLLTSASYFVFVAILVRVTRLPFLVAPFVFPVFQLWLCVWTTDLEGGVFVRVLLSFPFGLLTCAGVSAALLSVERKAAVDEAG